MECEKNGLTHGSERIPTNDLPDENSKLRLGRYQMGLAILGIVPCAIIFNYFKWPPTLLIILVAIILGLIFGYFPRFVR